MLISHGRVTIIAHEKNIQTLDACLNYIAHFAFYIVVTNKALFGQGMYLTRNVGIIMLYILVDKPYYSSK